MSLDLEKIIEAAFEDRANVNASTQGEIREAVETRASCSSIPANCGSPKRSRAESGQSPGRSING